MKLITSHRPIGLHHFGRGNCITVKLYKRRRACCVIACVCNNVCMLNHNED